MRAIPNPNTHDTVQTSDFVVLLQTFPYLPSLSLRRNLRLRVGDLDTQLLGTGDDINSFS